MVDQEHDDTSNVKSLTRKKPQLLIPKDRESSYATTDLRVCSYHENILVLFDGIKFKHAERTMNIMRYCCIRERESLDTIRKRFFVSLLSLRADITDRFARWILIGLSLAIRDSKLSSNTFSLCGSMENSSLYIYTLPTHHRTGESKARWALHCCAAVEKHTRLKGYGGWYLAILFLICSFVFQQVCTILVNR